MFKRYAIVGQCDKASFRLTPIFGITNNRETFSCQLRANLVIAPCYEFDFQFIRSDFFEVKDGFFPLGIDVRAKIPMSEMMAKSSLLGRFPFNLSAVEFLNGFLPLHYIKAREGFARSCKDDKTAYGFVETVNWFEKDISWLLETIFDVSPCLFMEIGLRSNSTRFDGDEEMIIAVNLFQGGTLFFVGEELRREEESWRLPH